MTRSGRGQAIITINSINAYQNLRDFSFSLHIPSDSKIQEYLVADDEEKKTEKLLSGPK